MKGNVFEPFNVCIHRQLTRLNIKLIRPIASFINYFLLTWNHRQNRFCRQDDDSSIRHKIRLWISIAYRYSWFVQWISVQSARFNSVSKDNNIWRIQFCIVQQNVPTKHPELINVLLFCKYSMPIQKSWLMRVYTMQINDLPIHVGRAGVPSYSMSTFKSFCLYLVVTVFALFPDIPIIE